MSALRAKQIAEERIAGLIDLAETVILDLSETCDCADHLAEIALYRAELERLRDA